MPSHSDLLAIEPTILPAADGYWLAIAGPDAPVRVGAMGQSEAEARQGFAEALQRLDAALTTD